MTWNGDKDVPHVTAPLLACGDKRLTLEQLRVLLAICSFSGKDGKSWPSRDQISSVCGVHRQNVSAATSSLARLGWLAKTGNGGFGKSCRYVVTIPEIDSSTVAQRATVNDQTTVADSATVNMANTVAHSATVAQQATHTVAYSATPTVAQQATPKELTSELTKEESKPDATAKKTAVAPAKQKSALSDEMRAACVQTWDAYCGGYFERYRVDPIKNAKVAGQMVAFVKRIGMAEAHLIAGWFPRHASRFYVERGHSIDCLLRDAEKLRTEWATGSVMTASKARQVDRAGATLSAVDEILASRGESLGRAVA